MTAIFSGKHSPAPQEPLHHDIKEMLERLLDRPAFDNPERASDRLKGGNTLSVRLSPKPVSRKRAFGQLHMGHIRKRGLTPPDPFGLAPASVRYDQCHGLLQRSDPLR